MTRLIEKHVYESLRSSVTVKDLEHTYTQMEHLGIAAGKHKLATRAYILADRQQDQKEAAKWEKRRMEAAIVEDLQHILTTISASNLIHESGCWYAPLPTEIESADSDSGAT
jgi:uncharacterized protein (DUF1015 family)